jgi:hypothetical protein
MRAGAVAVFGGLAFAGAWLRVFDHDELEAVHTAWKMWTGERIYIDFFQHHHPLFYRLLIPVLDLFGAKLRGCSRHVWSCSPWPSASYG